ncbi:MAG: hypothetical protein KDA96_21570 [Planctomycetaceae bacterium]|nr:hypothetical protein [Planctomycetaceae bacterium]
MSQEPYDTLYEQQRPPQQNNTLKIVLIVVGGLIGVGLLTCGAGLFWLTKTVKTIAENVNFHSMIDGMENEILVDRLQGVSEVEAVTGPVTSVTFDYEKSVAEESQSGVETRHWHKVVGETTDPAAEDVYIIVTVADEDDPQEYISDAELVSAGGQRIPIQLKHVPYDDADSRTVYQQISSNERLTTSIGSIQHVTMNLDRSFDDETGADAYWYDVTGANGSATVRTDESEGIVVDQIELPDGTSWAPGQ